MKSNKSPSTHPASERLLGRFDIGGSDEQEINEAVIRRAAEDVDLAFEFLEDCQFITPAKRCRENPTSVPIGLMLLIAATLRLMQWERADQSRHLPSSLPSSASALSEIRGADSAEELQHRLKAIARSVFDAWFSQMSWTSLSIGTDVIVQGNDPEKILDELAQLIWQFRHLITTED